eukprot:gnl/TRDRNA2_/TRDRNA2_38959_c0_seq1.p1 gnl/TRDRNA2_/TRDRNA2_38959_c0~~gnl/TRDRNA2_/TRDRNA2_38959_c0_seq1.p1  ORF type:complete len:123 (-),score=25.03 gnl/TRDRNA2_/TRDRNA2_38959_c0_seq1:101-469(-)
MSAFDDVISEANALDNELSMYDRQTVKKPPTRWSAAVSRKDFNSDTGVRDFAAPKEAAPVSPGDEAVAQGPALPFRIKSIYYLPQAMGGEPMFVVGGAHDETGQKGLSKMPSIPTPFANNAK